MDSKTFKSHSISLFHVAHVSYLPESLRKKYMTEKHLKTMKTRLLSELAQTLEGEVELNAHVEVVEGNPIAETIDRIASHGHDLVLVGKGCDAHASVVFAEKLARRSDASLLLVPQGASPSCKKILCPTDYSLAAAEALKSARSWAELGESKSMTVYHVYRFPIYQYDAELELSTEFEWDYDRFDEDLRTHAEEKMDRVTAYLPERNQGVPWYTHVEGGDDVVTAILDTTTTGLFDLCVVGHRGHSLLESFFLGSETEKLMRRTRVPLLVHQSEEE